MVATGVRILGAGASRVLGGDRQALALVCRELADELLSGAVCVVVRAVDEVAAAIDVGVEDSLRLLALRAPAPVGAECHRAERQRRDAQAGATEEAVGVEGIRLIAHAGSF